MPPPHDGGDSWRFLGRGDRAGRCGQADSLCFVFHPLPKLALRRAGLFFARPPPTNPSKRSRSARPYDSCTESLYRLSVFRSRGRVALDLDRSLPIVVDCATGPTVGEVPKRKSRSSPALSGHIFRSSSAAFGLRPWTRLSHCAGSSAYERVRSCRASSTAFGPGVNAAAQARSR